MERDHAAQALRVLLVEDEPSDAEVMGLFLEMQEGFECVGCAENGKKALEMLAAAPVDAVLLDVYMPDMDGLDFLSRWRLLPEPKARVFVLSAYGSVGEEQLRHQALRLGASAYFDKGYPLELICTRIRSECENARRETRCSAQGREELIREIAGVMLDELMGTTRSAGRHYLQDMLLHVVLEKEPPWTVGEVYDWAAAKAKISPAAMVRAVREASKAISRNDSARWRRILAARGEKNHVLSNKTLLETLEQEILYQERSLTGVNTRAVRLK